MRNAPRLKIAPMDGGSNSTDSTSPTHWKTRCPSQQQKSPGDENVRNEDDEDDNAWDRDTEVTSNLSRALMTFQQAGTLDNSNSHSTLGMFGAKPAQDARRCQDKSLSASNAKYLTADGVGYLGSSYDSKTTLGMISTGTAKDTMRRNVPRLRRMQDSDLVASTIGTQQGLTVRKNRVQTYLSGSENDFGQGSEFSDFFMSKSTGSIRSGHQRHIQMSSDKASNEPKTPIVKRDPCTSDLLERYLKIKNDHRSDSSWAFPRGKGTAAAFQGRKRVTLDRITPSKTTSRPSRLRTVEQPPGACRTSPCLATTGTTTVYMMSLAKSIENRELDEIKCRTSARVATFSSEISDSQLQSSPPP